MEQVLFKVHARLLITSNRYLNYPIRRCIEWAALVGAIGATLSLVLLHRHFVTYSGVPQSNCIISLLQNATDTGTNLVEVSRFSREYDIIAVNILDPYDVFSVYFQRNASRTSLWPGDYLAYNTPPTFQNLEQSNTNSCAVSTETSGQLPSGNIHKYRATAKELNKRRGSFRYFFSFQRGTLMLTQEKDPFLSSSSLDQRNFSVLELSVTPDLTCLGQGHISTLLARWSNSYDVVVMNWAISAFQGTGYLYNTISKELFNLNYAADFVAKKGTDMSDMGRRESYTNKANYLLVVWRWGKNNILTPLLTMISSTLAEYIEATGLWTYLEDLMQRITGDFFGGGSTGTSNSGDAIGGWYALFAQANQYVAFRFGVIFSTSFLFFISTTLINYILRETQERMLRFTFLLQYYITHRIPYTLLIATHVIGSLVFVPILMGIYFFLFEFFSDQLVSSYQLLSSPNVTITSRNCLPFSYMYIIAGFLSSPGSVDGRSVFDPQVSCCFLFCICLHALIRRIHVCSLRSSTNIQYFPKIFCCYFCLFHVYFFSFPFGFCYLALFATVCFVLHAMIHFWNVYEVPAFEAGRISPVRPRMGGAAPAALPSATDPMQRRIRIQLQAEEQAQAPQQQPQQPQQHSTAQATSQLPPYGRSPSRHGSFNSGNQHQQQQGVIGLGDLNHGQLPQTQTQQMGVVSMLTRTISAAGQHILTRSRAGSHTSTASAPAAMQQQPEGNLTGQNDLDEDENSPDSILSFAAGRMGDINDPNDFVIPASFASSSSKSLNSTPARRATAPASTSIANRNTLNSSSKNKSIESGNSSLHPSTPPRISQRQDKEVVSSVASPLSAAISSPSVSASSTSSMSSPPSSTTHNNNASADSCSRTAAPSISSGPGHSSSGSEQILPLTTQQLSGSYSGHSTSSNAQNGSNQVGRGRADSMGSVTSHSSANSGSHSTAASRHKQHGGLRPNIYEPIEARRKRLERQAQMDRIAMERERAMEMEDAEHLLQQRYQNQQDDYVVGGECEEKAVVAGNQRQKVRAFPKTVRSSDDADSSLPSYGGDSSQHQHGELLDLLYDNSSSSVINGTPSSATRKHSQSSSSQQEAGYSSPPQLMLNGSIAGNGGTTGRQKRSASAADATPPAKPFSSSTGRQQQVGRTPQSQPAPKKKFSIFGTNFDDDESD